MRLIEFWVQESSCALHCHATGRVSIAHAVRLSHKIQKDISLHIVFPVCEETPDTPHANFPLPLTEKPPCMEIGECVSGMMKVV
jgi:hypothetical protein